MKTKRVSIKSGKPYDIYIGRPGPFGNPWSSKPSKYAEHIVSSKKESLESYRQYLLNNEELLKQIEDLRGKTIACWCKEDERCHGDIIIEILNRKRLF
jgi:hypothetical protein